MTLFLASPYPCGTHHSRPFSFCGGTKPYTNNLNSPSMSSSEVPPYSDLYAASVSLTATTFIAGISWGIMTAFYSVCICGLVRNLRSANATRKIALLAIWITVLWFSATLSTLGNAICSIYAYSWQMAYPGGPAAYLAGIWNMPLPAMTVATYILTMWFGDAMMVSSRYFLVACWYT